MELWYNKRLQRMAAPGPRHYEFGPFRLYSEQHALFRGSERLPPQAGLPAGDYGPLLLRVLAQSPAPFTFTAYGTSTDNVTGDGWIVHAINQ